jgi:ABC-type amino acid transport substrate-binding protein
MVSVAAQARPLDEVTASRELLVIVYADNEPFSWEEKGEAKGIDVDIGRALAARLGVAAKIIVRIQGEKVDDDLRSNIWRGPLTGGAIGDVMMHVPIDRELAIRNNLAVIGNPYFEERVSLAIDPAKTGPNPTYDVFKTMKVGVQLGTVADYFLMRYDNGALINNVDHHLRPEQGIERFIKGETAAIMGVRSFIEAMLHERKVAATWVDPPAPGIFRQSWRIGTAVKDNSRDLHYAIGNALRDMAEKGELAAITKKYGVTYVAPSER